MFAVFYRQYNVNINFILFLLVCYYTDVCEFAEYWSCFVYILLTIVNLIYMYLMYRHIDGVGEMN